MIRIIKGGLPAFIVFSSVGLTLEACVSDKGAALAVAETSSSQPAQGRTTYRCGDAGAIEVDYATTTVTVVDQEGEQFELAAAPPDQSNRFAQAATALLLEDGEAFYVKAGREPITCTR